CSRRRWWRPPPGADPGCVDGLNRQDPHRRVTAVHAERGETPPTLTCLPACRFSGTSAWPCRYQDQGGLPVAQPKPHNSPMTTTPTSALPLTPGRWALDTNHSSVGFT